MPLSRRALRHLPLLALLGGCSPAGLVNALTTRGGYGLRGDLRYGPGPRGLLDLYEPEGGDPAAPLIVFFYGGGWKSGERRDYRFVAQALTTLGCAVAVPDYRLYPEVAWPGFVQDGAAAVAWLRQGPAAARPIIVMGHSAGAFIAAALACDPRWLGRAGQEGLAGCIGLAGPYDFQPEEADYRAIFAAAPQGRGTAFASDLSGIPPLLLQQGLDDDTVSPERSRELAALARRAGRPARLIEYPGVGHIGIIAALAAPLRGLGLAGAPVLADIGAFLGTLPAARGAAAP